MSHVKFIYLNSDHLDHGTVGVLTGKQINWGRLNRVAHRTASESESGATPPSNGTGRHFRRPPDAPGQLFSRPPDAPGQLFGRPPSGQRRKEKKEINNGFVNIFFNVISLKLERDGYMTINVL